MSKAFSLTIFFFIIDTSTSWVARRMRFQILDCGQKSLGTNSLNQGSGTFLTQRAMKAKYLEIYFSESHIIYFKTEFN